MKYLKLIFIIILLFSILDAKSQDTLCAKIPGSGKFEKYMAKHMMYPNEAASEGITGQVEFAFKINKDGCIEQDSIIIISSPHSSFSEEVIRALKSTGCNWTPAKTKDQPVDQWLKSYVFFGL